ncbi:hypothetical protein OROGR_032834 [Orobanche gracilis]
MTNLTSSNVRRSPIAAVESSAAAATAGKNQMLVTYLSDVLTEVSAGLDPSYHFYGNIYAIMIWACEVIPSLGSKCETILGASFSQQPRCTRWKLKKLGHVAFTTFFNDEPPEFSDTRSSPDCIFFGTGFIDGVVEQSANKTRRHIDEVLDHDATFGSPLWDLRGLSGLMSNFPHNVSVPTETQVAQTESIPTDDVDAASSPIEQIDGVPSPSRASVPVEHTFSLDHQSAAPTVTPCYSFSPSLNHQSSVPTVTPLLFLLRCW